LQVVENAVDNHPDVDWNGWLEQLPARHKDREDLLDACVCALAGLNLHKPQVPNVLLGRPETGYILAPLHPEDEPRLTQLPDTDWLLL
jgi:predicted RNase H-like nuclease